MTGFYIGPNLEVSFLGVALETSILYSQKGIKIEDENGERDEKTGYIEVPVTLRYKLGLPIVSRVVTPFIDAGPYIAFKVSGDENIGSIGNQWKTKSFGAGLNFGLGVELFSKVQVRGGYSLGLTDNYEHITNNFTVKDRTWQIGAAVFF